LKISKIISDYEFDQKQPLTNEKPTFQHRKKGFETFICLMTIKVHRYGGMSSA